MPKIYLKFELKNPFYVVDVLLTRWLQFHILSFFLSSLWLSFPPTVISTYTAKISVCEKPKDFTMPHRMLGKKGIYCCIDFPYANIYDSHFEIFEGKTGMQVSILSYGFWASFGDKSDLKDGNKYLLLPLLSFPFFHRNEYFTF